MRVRHFSLAALIVLRPSLAAPAAAQQAGTLRSPDVIFVPTPQEVVDAMLKMAEVTAKRLVYDLGSGDGAFRPPRRRSSARAPSASTSIPSASRRQREPAKANVGDKVKFLNQDLFETDISQATVITLYLLPSLNSKLIPS